MHIVILMVLFYKYTALVRFEEIDEDESPM